MPKHLRCVVDDFRSYLLSEAQCFDAIAIDVGGPGFNFEDKLHLPTCRSIRSRLLHSGRVIIKCFGREMTFMQWPTKSGVICL